MFANPYNACAACGRRVVDVNPQGGNEPCGHNAGWKSVCPSWSPVDGCRCVVHLGYKAHGLPPH